MANSYFQFKQFRINQQHCAMKVTTDACLFGAWAAGIASEIRGDAILDIGTGTGLLALMVAQQNETARINAIEIDSAAANEARDNLDGSAWKNRLQVIEGDIKDYALDNGKQYDFIITNPPFFDNDLKSGSAKRNLAMHAQALSLEELLEAIKRLLSREGSFAILLPYHRSAIFEGAALRKGFFLQEKVSVRQTPTHPHFRTMLLFGTHPTSALQKEIIIKDNDNYTPAFSNLLKDYYLYL